MKELVVGDDQLIQSNVEGVQLVYYKDTPYSGKSKFRSSVGGGLKESNWKDGKRDGLSTHWYENGQKSFERNYKDGKVMSAKVWKTNGEKCAETKIDKEGNGVVVGYNEDGAANFRNIYKNGEPVDLEEEFDVSPDYELFELCYIVHRRSSLKSRKFYAGLRTMQLREGVPDGLYIRWIEKGQKIQEIGTKDWNGKGQKISETNYRNGKLDGLVTWWFANGQMRHEKKYKDGKLVSAVGWTENGEKCPETNVSSGNGTVSYISQEGRKSRFIYSEGMLVESDCLRQIEGKWRNII